MSWHTYDYFDGKPAAVDLSRCSACDLTAATDNKCSDGSDF